jgi:mono/diheme cytochrome c family protein
MTNFGFVRGPCFVLLNTGLFLFLLAAGFGGRPAAAQTATPALEPVEFQRDIRPLLSDRCFACHGPDAAQRQADLRIDLEEGAKVSVIVAGDPNSSELYARISSDDPDYRMPPASTGKTLSPKQIELIRRWIEQGAKYEPHWAFKRLAAVSPPDVKNKAWVRNPIDAFVLARLEQRGIEPVAEASRELLARRLSLDITGLPPTPEWIDAFVADPSPTAYDARVEELIDSPRYGEKWSRHWLDVVRYADSEGYENDLEKPLSYRYRDWVIKSFNEDLPYDQFVRFQVAGDEYEPDNPDAMAATGFISVGPRVVPHATDTEANKERYFYDELDDIVNTLGQGFLGLTVGCARCHDHKFDPIPSREYYRLAAVFGAIERREAPLSQARRDLELWLETKREELRIEKMDQVRVPSYDRVLLLGLRRRDNSSQETAYGEWESRLDFSEAEFQEWLGEAGRAELARLQKRAEGQPDDRGWIALDRQATPLRRHYLARGDVNKKLESVTFGFLSAPGGDKSAEEYRDEVVRTAPHYGRTTFQRRALAEWLVDVEHGAGALTARVIVNRLWYHHFGQGIVRTPNDFGLQGEPPTHPELLEWLAGELVRNGWRLEPIQRLILASSTYRLSTEPDPQKLALDPDNKLLWHRRPIRLDSENLRDSILAVAGSLNLEMYGPGVRPVIPAEAIATKAKDRWPRGLVEGPENWRRTIYLFRKRSVTIPMMEVFDAPDENMTCGRRVQTTVPTQALALLNDQAVRRQAEIFAERVKKDAPDSSTDPVERAYRLALGRYPFASERLAAA